MRKNRGIVLIYIIVIGLLLLIIGSIAYLGVSHEQSMKIAELQNKEETNKSTKPNVEEISNNENNESIVPVYTPEQFALVGSGEEVFVREEGKTYVYSTDKTYMFYGMAEELTTAVKEQLSEQLKNEIIVEINEKGLIVSTIKAQKPEIPRLAQNMVAVYWSKDGGITASEYEEGASAIYSKIDANGKPSSTGMANPSFREENWYEYVQQSNFVDEKISRWANGVTDDGSYWVWIPRFKYKILSKPGSTDTSSAGVVDVKFIRIDEASGTEGYVTRRNADGEYITQDDEGYIIHPAFENGSSTGKNNAFANGEWDSEIAGFWIAKYEMSMENGSGNTIITNSESIGDVEISDSVKMVSKPGVSGWRYIKVGQVYQNCINYAPENGSHLIKNSEWGAMAYLTQSRYGRNGHEVTINISNKTGNAGSSPTDTGESGVSYSYNTLDGMLASTTGNIYGVYDVNGGLWEIMAVWNTGTNSTEKISNGSTFASIGGGSTKYATAYKNTTETSSGSIVREVCKTGDAVKEVWVNDKYLWFNDYAECLYLASPYTERGGGSSLAANSGIFNSSNGGGGGAAVSWVTFRAVMIVED